MRRAVFLDRDGVINRAFVMDGVPTPPKNLIEVEVIFGVKEAIKLLTESHFVVVVVTNQPDVARGTSNRDSIESINSYLGHELGIEHFFTCFHDDPQGCDCRKPKPGLLQNAASELDLDLQNSYLVGDRWRDIAAGQAAGCKCYFIDYQYEGKSPKLPFTKVSSLIEAARLILENLDDTFS
jgi:D-glycero-D-manno-heptose 1,7-bisphosphate phosphatase